MLSAIWILCLRSYFLLISAIVIIVHAVPILHTAFIPYGKTRRGPLKCKSSVIELLANVTVPKAWFWHYYIISVTLSILSGWQLLECSYVGQYCSIKLLETGDPTTVVAWGMMLVQGSRRLYECLRVQKASNARMWIGHYLVGCTFYIMMCATIFAEGILRTSSVSPRFRYQRRGFDLLSF